MRRAMSPFASSLATLLAGLVLGLILRGTAPLPLSLLATAGVWLGSAWLALLSLLAAIGTTAQSVSVGRLLGRTVTAIVVAMVATGVLTLATLQPLLAWAVVPLGPGAVAAASPAHRQAEASPPSRAPPRSPRRSRAASCPCCWPRRPQDCCSHARGAPPLTARGRSWPR